MKKVKNSKNTVKLGTMGYVIEYQEKGLYWEASGEKKTALCSQETLAILLQKPISYRIWCAHFCNLEQYILNHSRNEYEIL